MSSTQLLSVRNLTTSLEIEGKIYKVIDDFSFLLSKGKTLALVGESGCGKSMTALSILRILPEPPALQPQGEILYYGKNLLTLSEKEMRKIRGSRIAMIFQNPMTALNPVYTIGEQLLEVARVHLKLSGQNAEERALLALERVHLPDPRARMKEYPHQMSGGMLQRAMIAMALICEPDILIADEPTTALDVTIQAQILGLLQELQERTGMAILLITHDMGVVAEIAHDVIVMYATQKIEECGIERIFQNPAHPYTQGLFQSRPDRPLKWGKLTTIKGSVPPITHMPEGCHFNPRCPYVMPICRKGEVPFFETGKNHQITRCWLYDPHLKEKLQVEEIDETDS